MALFGVELALMAWSNICLLSLGPRSTSKRNKIDVSARLGFMNVATIIPLQQYKIKIKNKDQKRKQQGAKIELKG